MTCTYTFNCKPKRPKSPFGITYSLKNNSNNKTIRNDILKLIITTLLGTLALITTLFGAHNAPLTTSLSGTHAHKKLYLEHIVILLKTDNENTSRYS